jgi:hypothetical protein
MVWGNARNRIKNRKCEVFLTKPGRPKVFSAFWITFRKIEMAGATKTLKFG